MSNENNIVERFLYKEIKPGDLRKILRESNDSPTGGGARDFRFGSYSKLEKVIKKLFPNVEKQVRTRNKVKVEIDVFKGTFSWESNGKIITKDSYFEPPTDARPEEGRITRVPEYECFDTSRIPDIKPNNRVLLLLIQLSDGSVWPHFVLEETFRTKGNWHPKVEKHILRCLDAERAKSRAVIGYYDFQTKEGYCDGK